MKRKGRYVLEAALLVPGVCILLVYVVFFTLYAHDCAVCVHTVLEAGIEGCYQDGRSGEKIRADVEQEIRKKLSERLLWLQDETVEVSVNPVRLQIRMEGVGSFLPVDGIEVRQAVYRVRPCEVIRRSRWLRADGGEKNGDTL